ncbi:MAG TPA: hypothetical protein VG603_06555 [Chitinophagales bacterium]|nr:hypothetical protein [Chitinophagales bacterium]
MVKGFIAILIVAGIIGQSAVNVGISIYYHLDQKYIAQQLCVNRNNPQLHCNGHCYLVKQLKKAEQSEKQSAQFIKEREGIIGNINQSLGITHFAFYKIALLPGYKSSLYPSAYPGILIKPPAA